MGGSRRSVYFLEKKLALGELRSAAGLLKTELLALDDASIARKETSALEVGTVVASVQQSTSDAEAQGASLTGDAATIAQGDDVERKKCGLKKARRAPQFSKR